MRAAQETSIELFGRRISYRLVSSRTAKKLRVRVGINGVEVLQPVGRTKNDVESFLIARAQWLMGQVRRAESLRNVRRVRSVEGQILFKGEPTRIRLEQTRTGSFGNKVAIEDGEIVIRRGEGSRTHPARSLERWLRKQAHATIKSHLHTVTTRLKQMPAGIYVMGQRTKWGNCSARRNLSFNWRLVLAPDFVLRYLVTHEAVHLAIPDHSRKFWLTVQSLCPETERARQWLCANEGKLRIDLHGAIAEEQRHAS